MSMKRKRQKKVAQNVPLIESVTNESFLSSKESEKKRVRICSNAIFINNNPKIPDSSQDESMPSDSLLLSTPFISNLDISSDQSHSILSELQIHTFSKRNKEVANSPEGMSEEEGMDSEKIINEYKEAVGHPIESSFEDQDDKMKTPTDLEQDPSPIVSTKSAGIDPGAVSNFSPTGSNVFGSRENSTNSDICLIAMQKDETICFKGYVLISPIYGNVKIMGNILHGKCSATNDDKTQNLMVDIKDEFFFQPVFSPQTHALAVIECMTMEATSRKTSRSGIKASEETMKKIQKLLKNLNCNSPSYDSILALQRMDWCGIADLEKISTSIFRGIFSVDSIEKVNSKVETQIGEPNQIRIEDIYGIPGFHPIFEPKPGITSLKYPDSWLIAANQISTDSLMNDSQPNIIVCGHKKVGKSTFSRFLMNHLLNSYSKIAYIESDIGQSEFTPSGLVSLNLIDSPLFGPPFTHLKRPYRSYFIGHTTPKDDPDYYLECLEELVNISQRDIAADFNELDLLNPLEIPSRIPVIINTHGWVKGMGYDLLLHIIKLFNPTHICQFQSNSHPYLNLPLFPSSILSSADEKSCKILYVDSVHHSPNPSRFIASFHRTLTLLSYFYSTPSLSSNCSDKWWDCDKSLVQHLPRCLDWTKGLTKGVFMLFGEVSWSQLLYALNGSIVGLIGDLVDEDQLEEEEEQNHEWKDDKSGPGFEAPLYFPSPRFPPPPPAHHTCHGLALIRSIDAASHTFHILTPLPHKILKKTNAIVKGALELPVCASLDHTMNTSLGICRLPWKKVPYLTVDVSGGAGHAVPHVRRNLMRRGQMTNG
ncbi:hypothetical protein G9A89_004230 [Geosiphon pyriformis]|nr:hypothetical protein G9A89_004230 [Geosiphon pyriformis]